MKINFSYYLLHVLFRMSSLIFEANNLMYAIYDNVRKMDDVGIYRRYRITWICTTILCLIL